MSYFDVETMAHSLWADFAGMHILYQIGLIALTIFLVWMILTFAYNMIHLAFTFTKDLVEMLIDVTKKILRDVDKFMQHHFDTKPFMPAKVEKATTEVN